MKTRCQIKKSLTRNSLSFIVAVATAASVLGCGLRDPRFKLLSRSQSGLSTGVANKKVDILWVIDNSGTMGPKQTNLKNSINSFMNQFVSKNMDYHIAVVTTDIRAIDPLHPNDPNFSGQDSCFVGSPTVVTSTTPNPAQTVGDNANVGFFGSADAHSIDAVMRALSAPRLTGCNAGFLRDDAFLAVIMFSDADDNTAATSTQLLNFLDTVKAPISIGGSTVRPYFVSGMVVEDLGRAACIALGPFSELGTKFISLAGSTSGTIASICDADFSAGLLAIGNQVLEQTTALQLSTVPDPATIYVFLANGTPVTQGSTNGWTYDSATNRIVFHGTAIPDTAGVSYIVNFTPRDIIR